MGAVDPNLRVPPQEEPPATLPLDLQAGTDNSLERTKPAKKVTLVKRIGALLRRLPVMAFVLVTVFPVVIAAVYLYGFAADQYVAQASFWVRSQRMQMPSLLGGLLGTGSLSASPEESLSVQDYIRSHGATLALQQRINVREIYRRKEVDWFDRLPEDASLERMVKYLSRMIDVRYEDRSGITTIRVFAFRPADARLMAETLLQLSEELVNTFNRRSIEDSLRLGRNEVALAEHRAVDVRARLTQYRQRVQELDPKVAAESVLRIVGELETELAQTRAEITQASAFMRADNPRLVTLRARADSLAIQIKRERARLTGSTDAVVGMISEYEMLAGEEKLVDQSLASAPTSLEQARLEAQRQQLYLVRVVEPQLPEESLYPCRWLLLLGLFCGATAVYGIGLLVVTGARDHLT